MKKYTKKQAVIDCIESRLTLIGNEVAGDPRDKAAKVDELTSSFRIILEQGSLKEKQLRHLLHLIKRCSNNCW